jgi:protein MpaA
VNVLIVGEIHGNERAGEAVARRLEGMEPPDDVAVWIVRELNPDGARAGTRQNAHGVDLNRNFKRGWRPLPRGTYYSGPGPFSEPESRAAKRLILRIRPRVAVWYHQHLRLVDETTGGGDVRVPRRYARLVDLPVDRLPLYPGSATRWENHEVARGTGFVVELPEGSLTDASARRHARAVMTLGREATP